MNLINTETKTINHDTLNLELSQTEKQVMVDLTKMARSFSGQPRATLVKASAMLSSAVHMTQLQALALTVLAQKYEPTSVAADASASIPESTRQTILETLAKDGVDAELRESEFVPTGLSILQETKYTTDGTHIVNRSTGEPIPIEEPIMILRAKDPFAALVISLYLDMISPKNVEHHAAVARTFMRFMGFRSRFPQRMAVEPTTDLAAPSTGQE